jgi:hypothetical protein
VFWPSGRLHGFTKENSLCQVIRVGIVRCFLLQSTVRVETFKSNLRLRSLLFLLRNKYYYTFTPDYSVMAFRNIFCSHPAESQFFSLCNFLLFFFLSNSLFAFKASSPPPPPPFLPYSGQCIFSSIGTNSSEQITTA